MLLRCAGCDLSLPAKLSTLGLKWGASVGLDGHDWRGPGNKFSSNISESYLHRC